VATTAFRQEALARGTMILSSKGADLLPLADQARGSQLQPAAPTITPEPSRYHGSARDDGEVITVRRQAHFIRMHARGITALQAR